VLFHSPANNATATPAVANTVYVTIAVCSIDGRRIAAADRVAVNQSSTKPPGPAAAAAFSKRSTA
jgi:hypothetical protein